MISIKVVNNMRMSCKCYDVLKAIAQYILPALGTLYFALAEIWHFPFAEEIVGTITAVDAFLGVLLKISSEKYYSDISVEPIEDPDQDNNE